MSEQQEVSTELNSEVEFKRKPIGGFIVIDTESASLAYDPAIITFSAVFYNLNLDGMKALENPELLDGRVLNLAPSLREQFFLGCDFCRETQSWHLKKNANFKESMSTRYEDVSVNDMFVKINDFISKCYNEVSLTGDEESELLIFCRRTHADWIWLDSLAKKAGVKLPIAYNNIFDVPSFISGATRSRTEYFNNKKYKFKSHDALGDAKRDAINILLALQ